MEEPAAYGPTDRPTFLFYPQGFVFEAFPKSVLVWPLTEEAENWLRLIVEARWPDRAVYFYSALVVDRKKHWCETFDAIYQAGWRWSADQKRPAQPAFVKCVRWSTRHRFKGGYKPW